MENKVPTISKEKSTIANILLSSIYGCLLLGAIYIIPEPVQKYVVSGYGWFLVVMSFIFLVTYISSLVSPTVLDNNIEKTVAKRLKANDKCFIRRALNPVLAWFQSAATSLIALTIGVVGGNLFESVFFMVAFAMWATIYFLTIERVNSRIYANYRQEILNFINNKEAQVNQSNQ